MHFFLYEILARVVAAALFVYTGRRLWLGLTERKIEHTSDYLWCWTTVAHRDGAPVVYWMTIGIEVMGLVACLFVAVFGWWHPAA